MALPTPPSPSDNRFTLVTPDDYQGYIYIATITSLVWSSIVFIVRLFIKWGCYSGDDVLAGLAQAISFGQWIPVFIALENGLGKNISSPDKKEQFTLAEATAASRIILIVVLALCKSSVLLLIQRIFAQHDSKKSLIRYLAGQGVIALWGIASVLAISIRCSPNHILPGDRNGQCSGDVLRWKVITAFDVLIELALVILPAYLVSRVRIQLGKKLVVVVAFAFRLPAAGFFIAHLTAYSDPANHRNTGTKFSTPIVWQQVVIAYSLAAVTIPTLKPFLQGFNTGGMGYTSEAIIGSSAATPSMGSGQRSGWGGKQLSSNSSGLDGKMRLRPERACYSADVACNGVQREDASVMSDNSQEMIIRKDVNWEVRRD
ncbi:hypothetical protein W97_07485 [Coniosporium apollinis CBS 100218]|uniref:Rhodopsin domain-containing protein n=1 Tax=Coniosporium apollinis (strain CBS 100218) TaxID=1168221 RepID=R7Z239_CONA1|nr:uncharacterized protein W97_07485 [Coniosporium apollinis CBS 100218]EON68227.1 hypothetical protein W97_07485 [Coniosporium apollinis CBS 100218]